MAWQNRILGLVLIHCLATHQGIIETFKEIVRNKKGKILFTNAIILGGQFAIGRWTNEFGRLGLFICPQIWIGIFQFKQY